MFSSPEHSPELEYAFGVCKPSASVPSTPGSLRLSSGRNWLNISSLFTSLRTIMEEHTYLTPIRPLTNHGTTVYLQLAQDQSRGTFCHRSRLLLHRQRFSHLPIPEEFMKTQKHMWTGRIEVHLKNKKIWARHGASKPGGNRALWYSRTTTFFPSIPSKFKKMLQRIYCYQCVCQASRGITSHT